MKEIKLETKIRIYPLTELQEEESRLMEAAIKATEQSYAPYSKFHVGAAALLEDGTIVTGPSTFYIEANKTLKGTYDKEVWGEEKSNRVLKPSIFIAGQDGYAESRNAKKQKYIINYNQTWTGGLIYFNISDETVAGHPNRRVLVDFSDRPNERADGYDQIVDSGSYLDTDTGDIYFNLRVMDGAYGATGGFGIEVLLSNSEDH